MAPKRYRERIDPQLFVDDPQLKHVTGKQAPCIRATARRRYNVSHESRATISFPSWQPLAPSLRTTKPDALCARRVGRLVTVGIDGWRRVRQVRFARAEFVKTKDAWLAGYKDVRDLGTPRNLFEAERRLPCSFLFEHTVLESQLLRLSEIQDRLIEACGHLGHRRSRSPRLQGAKPIERRGTVTLFPARSFGTRQCNAAVQSSTLPTAGRPGLPACRSHGLPISPFPRVSYLADH